MPTTTTSKSTYCLYNKSNSWYNLSMNNKYTFERAYGMTKRGLDRQIGWDIFCDGNWCSRWSTLRDAPGPDRAKMAKRMAGENLFK